MTFQESSYEEQSLFIHDGNSDQARAWLRTRSLLWITLLSLVVLLALPSASFGQAALTDDADTQTGNTPNLSLSSNSNVYLKFKLSSTLPPNTPGSDVARATIKLYLGAVKSPGAVDVYQISSSWSEHTVASAPPSLGGILQAGIPVQSDQGGKFLVLDVTSAVQQWLGTDGSGTGGAPNYGVALVARDGARLTFDSKENPQTSHEPQLNIQMNKSAGPQGDKGDKGDKGDTGLQGPQGEKGEQGEKGDTGDTGATGPQGLKGDTGSTGPQGPQGVQGNVGPQGPAGPQGAKGLNWKGAWDVSTNYVIDDAVSHLGSSWRAVRDNANVTPVEGVDWTIVAQKGDDTSGGTVTEVTGNGPISVTNPTTTPNISLGIVPTINGGTGLNSAGAAGSFLRSDGSTWTSGPLLAPDLPAGSGHYIQNATGRQAAANFNIGGTGTADILDAATQYNIDGKRILSTPGTVGIFERGNLVVGRDAGSSITLDATFNSFFGNSSGSSNTTGDRNVFGGWGSGFSNTTGGQNSFFGVNAGRRNASGEHNTHLGFSAGIGYQAGSWNTFIGSESGGPISELRDGTNNTALGHRAWVDDGLIFAAAIGAQAVVTASDTVVIGKKAGTYNGVSRRADRVEIPGDLTIAGSFGANILDAATQFNLGGNRILSTTGTNNLFVGVDAGLSNTSGGANSFFGRNAGRANTDGFNNSFFGTNAGVINTSGNSNAFFGAQAGVRNTTGSLNSFFGNGAGFSNSTGSFNSFFGQSAGIFNSSGDSNSFFGVSAGNDNSTGSLNSFFGSNSGRLNTSGHSNSFFGQTAGLNNTTGIANSFFGVRAGINNSTGPFNSFFGLEAGINNLTGANNSFFGIHTGVGNTTGSSITLIGANADVGADNLTWATAIGAGAFVNTSNTVVVGRSFDTVQVPGALNVTGAIGANTLNATMQFNIGGNRVLSVSGSQSLPNSNIFAGVGAGASNTDGSSNSFFGSDAGQANTTGWNNVFVGGSAGLKNTLGFGNSFLGTHAGQANTTGGRNTFVGFFTGQLNVTGAGNTFIGANAGYLGINPTGDNNTLLGASTFLNPGLSNATAIGSNALVTQSNSLVLGSIAGLGGAITDTNVGIGTTAPRTKLHVASGKIYVEANGQGVILKSPGGACFELTVTDGGTLTTAVVACP